MSDPNTVSGRIEQLRAFKGGQKIRVVVDTGEQYTLFVIGRPEYDGPGADGEGYLEMDVEFDDDAHEIPTDVLPSSSGDIRATTDWRTGEFNEPLLSVWAPVVDDDGNWVSDDWQDLGYVRRVDKLEREGDE